jgi:cyclic-di-GMP phosphodiesterase TipF (flagellum assembly factor)
VTNRYYGILILFYAALSIFTGVVLSTGLSLLTRAEAILFAAIEFLILLLLHESIARLRYQQKIVKTIKSIRVSLENIINRLAKLPICSITQQPLLKELAKPQPINVFDELMILESILAQLTVTLQTAEQTAAHRSQELEETIVPSQNAEVDNNFPQQEELIQGVHLDRTRLLKILHEILSEDRIEMCLQPIVSLPQRKVRYFECFSRLRDQDDMLIMPDLFLDIAHEEYLIRIIDNTLLFRCIQLVRKMVRKKIDIRFFCHLSLSTLRDHCFLDSLIEFMTYNKELIPNIIFEINYTDFQAADVQTRHLLERLIAYGCLFSANHIKSLTIPFEELEAYRFRFMKVDAALLLSALEKDEQGGAIHTFKKSADRHHIDIIVTKIEKEQELVDLLEFHFDYGQGYLFSAPQQVKNW